MDYEFLLHTPLFTGLSSAELPLALDGLNAHSQHFARGAVVFRAGEPASSMGLVLAGRIQIENDDLWGNKSVLDSIGPGLVFAETYACLPGEPLMVSAVAAEPSEILFLDIHGIIKPDSPCPHRGKLLQNLLSITSQKNLNLSRRIFHTSSKTIRGRLLSYLSFQAVRCGGRTFSIPFNRQQLADYLSVDRSALSNELSKMQREGLLQVERNHFTLKQDVSSIP